MEDGEEATWGEWAARGIGIACVVVCLLAFFPGWEYVGKLFADKDAPAWVQAVGSILAILVAVAVAYWQGREARRREAYIERQDAIRERNLTVALLNTLCGAVYTVNRRFEPGKDISAWDVRMMRVLLRSELENSKSMPVHSLVQESQKAFLGFRLIALQLIEALEYAEGSITKAEDGRLVVDENAQKFLMRLIQDTSRQAVEQHDVLKANGL